MSQNINFERFNRLSADLQFVTVYNGDIVHCNPAAQLLYKQAGKEQTPATIFDFVSADELHFFSFQLAQSAASGVGNKFLTRYASASGIRWLLWHTDIDQSNEHMYWIGQDVTELKRSTASLEILEEVTATGVWELDKQTNTPYWSKKTHQIHQTDSQHFTPRIDDALSFFPPAAQSSLKIALAKLEADGTPYDLQLPFVTAKGDKRIVNAHGHAQKIGNKVVRLYGTFKDITEEVSKHEEEQRMHTRMALALEFSKIGVWEYRVDNDTLVWDSRMFAIYEPPVELFAGELEDWRKAVHPEDLAAAIQSFKETMLTGKPYIQEFRILTPGNTLKYIRAMASVLHDKEGKVNQLIGVNLDITADVELTLQLEKAKEAAEAANHAQSRFLALMSHEIRTPLNGLIGSLQVLEGLATGNRESQFITQSLSSARTLVAIINDILDYSKAAENRMTLEELPVNLKELLSQVINEQSAVATQKRIALTLAYPDDEPSNFEIDPLRFKQVMSNLVSNAIKFTHKGYVSVAVETRTTPEPLVVIQVRDSGIGIRQEQLAKLFTPFTQGDVTTTRQYGGSGLGLSIVEQLVKLMGGEIQVESTPDIGSCFTILLPRTAYHPETMSAPTSTPPSAPEAPDMSHLRVLIAEDNEINQLVVEAFLLECGTQATFVDNGARLVETVKSTQYDLILCDIRMPVMGGIEACTKIREFNPDIPILAFTANVMQDDVRAYLEAGFTDVISKPVERLKLFEQLAGYLQPRS